MWLQYFFVMTLFGLMSNLGQALKEGDYGVCITSIRKTHPTIKIVSIKEECPRGMDECPVKKKMALKTNPKTERCCIGPSQVRKPACCDNFQFDPDKGVCIPQCNPPCIGGDCIAPNECRCPESLALDSLNTCYKPVCEVKCFNGDCVANDTCKCTTGYEAFNTTHCKHRCEDGYVNDPNNLECVPKCDNSCLNGNCTAPNTCTCSDGYKKLDYTQDCIPVCSPECVNGNCTSPNSCSCYNLYKSDNSTHCSPICEQNCSNGVCTKPNECKCNEGYKLDGEDKFTCNPICIDVCEYKCVAPNLCGCDKGYKIDEHDHTKCVPVCENKCINGVCSLPNTCTCNEHFEVGDNYWICKHKCTCEHGTCSSEGKCICNNGYKIENDTCTSIASSLECSSCKSECQDGDCLCEDGRRCMFYSASETEKAISTGLAGFHLTWTVLAAVGVLLILLVLVVMHRLYYRKRVDDTPSKQKDPYGSVVCYNVPNTLLQRDPKDEFNEANEDEETDAERLPMTQVIVKTD